MSASVDITAREVFDRFQDTGQVLVAKNLPEGVKNQLSLMQNYFEVICDNSVAAFHFPAEAHDIVLILFEEKAEDFERYHKALLKKPLLNVTVEISALGSATGLVVSDVPDGISDSLLVNYLENKRSGGRGDCVEDTASYTTGVGGRRLVVIVISDVKVVKSILAKPDHDLAEQTLNLEPYFTSFHGYLVKKLYPYSVKRDSPRKTKQLLDKKAKPEETPIRTDGSHKAAAGCQGHSREHRTDTPSVFVAQEHTVTNNNSTMVYTNDFGSDSDCDATSEIERKTLSHDDGAEKQAAHSEDLLYTSLSGLKIYFNEEKGKPVDAKQSIPRVAPTRQQEEHVTQIKSPEMTFEKFQKLAPFVPEHIGNQFENSNKLQSNISTDALRSEKNAHQKSAKFNHSKRKEDNASQMGLADNKGLNRRGKLHKRRGNGSRDTQQNDRGPHSVGFDCADGDTVETVELNYKMIQLLKIGVFCKKLTSCKARLNERESHVIFSGSREDIKFGKIQMYETLQKVHNHSENMPLEIVSLLSRPECKICLKERMIKDKIYAVVVADVESSSLQSSAFYSDVAVKAIDFVKNQISAEHIKLREGQISMLKLKEWEDLVGRLNSGLVYVGIQSNNEQSESLKTTEPIIVIKSLIRHNINSTTRQSIIEFLKSHTPRQQTKFSLCGAEARCFQAKFEIDLRRHISQMKGQLQVSLTKHEPPIQVEIMVTGDTVVTSTTDDCLKRIWHEKFDFAKISLQEKDLRLLMHGLGGIHGHTFIQQVERSLDCFIDLVKKGEYPVKPPTATTTQSPIRRSSNQEDQPSQVLFTTSDVGETMEDDLPQRHMEDTQEDVGGQVPARWANEDKISRYQSGVSYQDALQRALQQSLSEDDPLEPESPYGTSQFQQESPTGFRQDLSYEAAIQHALQQSQSEDDLIPLEPESPYQTSQFQQESPYDAEDFAAYRPPVNNRPYGYEVQPTVHPRRGSHHVMTADRQQTQPRRGLYHAMTADRQQTQPRRSYDAMPADRQQMGTCSVTVQGTTISLEQGAITKHTADVLVNVLHPSRDITRESVVSKSFVAAGGPQLVQSFNAARQNQQDPNQFFNQLDDQLVDQLVQPVSKSSRKLISTPAAGQLNCSVVHHVTLKKETRNPSRIITEVMGDCLQQCMTSGYTSISFPALGVGRLYQYRVDVVADAMIQAAVDSATTNRNMTQITFMAYDSATYKPFASGLTKYKDRLSTRGTLQPPRTPPHTRRAFHSNSSPNLNRPAMFPPASTPPHASPVSKSAQRGSSDVRLLYRRSADRVGHAAQHVDHRSAERVNSADKPGYRQAAKPSSYQAKQKVAKSPKFIDSRPAPKLVMTLFAENKDACNKARSELGKRLKDEFLYKLEMDCRSNISREDKNRIVKLLAKYHVDSVRASGKYILKGNKESVNEVYKQILQILLNAKEIVREEAPQRKRHEINRKSPEFMKFLAFEDIAETPHYWKNFQPGNPIKTVLAAVKDLFSGGSKCKKVTLSPNDREYAEIINLIKQTWSSGCVGKGKDAKGLDAFHFTNIHVTKIQRIENLPMYNRYTQKRVQFFEKLVSRGQVTFPDIAKTRACTGAIKTEMGNLNVLMQDIYSEINEYYLFHGTKADIVETICNDGLDSRLGSGHAMFGPGVYGAESPTKADQYTDSKDQRTRNGLQMFLIRMILGNSYVCTQKNPPKYRKPPCTNLKCLRDDCTNEAHKPCFDSVVGDKNWLFREFVTYEKDQCYPEYLITYNRV